MFKVGLVSGSNVQAIVPDSAVNSSMLFLGNSGSGKTMAMQGVEKSLAEGGGHVLAFNYNGTHENIINNSHDYNVIKVKKDGVPMPLLECFSSPLYGEEGIDDICDSVVETFSMIKRLGHIESYSLMEACKTAMLNRGKYDDDMACICDAINLLENDAKIKLQAKYHSILSRVKFYKEFDLWESGKATVLDLTGYAPSIQYALAQLVLSVLWRWHRVYGQRAEVDTWVALDEFQNLPLRKGSLLEQILREGRKYKLSLLLATQTLSGFDMANRAILQQPGTKLYFQPAEPDVRKIAKSLSDISMAEVESILKSLAVGECLAHGVFAIGRESKARTLKLNFWQ